jgi:enolase
MPQGASTGPREAIKLRDNTAPKSQLGGELLHKRFSGKRILAAINNVNAVRLKNIIGVDATDQEPMRF